VYLYLGLLDHHLGDNAAAQVVSRQAAQIMHQLGDRYYQAIALTVLGHALVGLAQWAAAVEYYQQALTLMRALQLDHRTVEPLAGLARAAQAQGRLIQAQSYVDEVLSLLAHGRLYGVGESVRVYLTCYHVLRANQDPRADTVLQAAHSILEEQAEKLEDTELQRTFLERVMAHCELVHELVRGAAS
jgi:tetratricopeptide (TPR) repeat protein